MKHIPVINQGRLYCQKQKRHDGVADGELCGCPSYNIVTQLQTFGAQEVMTDRLSYLVRVNRLRERD